MGAECVTVQKGEYGWDVGWGLGLGGYWLSFCNLKFFNQFYAALGANYRILSCMYALLECNAFDRSMLLLVSQL